MKKTLFKVAASACLLIAGCSKEQTSPIRSAPSIALINPHPTISNTKPCKACNPENPYDNIGSRIALAVAKGGQTLYTTPEAIQQDFMKMRGSSEIFKNYPATEPGIRQANRETLLNLVNSADGRKFMSEITGVLEQLKGTSPADFELLKTAVLRIEKKVQASTGLHPEAGLLLLTASVIRHLASQFLDVPPSASEGSPVLAKGIGGFFRKVAAVICAVGAGASVAAWHYIKGSPYDLLVEETARWSWIVGYYTGWWPPED